ncbi:MAG: ATP-dependent sacrificial sulfur transferase LarE [Planctomycetes bacterium]|nr:ATP-dependent sacrificial sulfur transferase LarE [Planctomycetota bacterium]
MSLETSQLIDALHANVAAHGSAAVAFSAGVDSTLVLKIAHDVLGERALGVTGIAPAVAPAEADDARRLADALGARLRFVETHELAVEGYASNPPDRCFHCKTELYAVCRRVAREQGLAAILNGTNRDDLGDVRPGLRAADEAGVFSPLLECGLDKRAVRAVARALGLPNWDKPALACLASRLPHGTRVTPERLAAVDAVERHLRSLGFRQVRARHLDGTVSLEVDAEDVPKLRLASTAPEFARVVRAAGFREFEVAADGYRRGRLSPAP